MVAYQVDDAAPRADGQVVTEALDRLQPRARYRARRRRTAGRMHHPVAVAVYHQRRDIDGTKFGGAVAGREYA